MPTRPNWRIIVDRGGIDYVCNDDRCLVELVAEKPHADIGIVSPANVNVDCAVCLSPSNPTVPA